MKPIDKKGKLLVLITDYGWEGCMSWYLDGGWYGHISKEMDISKYYSVDWSTEWTEEDEKRWISEGYIIKHMETSC
jgi:hypothetical protein